MKKTKLCIFKKNIENYSIMMVIGTSPAILGLLVSYWHRRACIRKYVASHLMKSYTHAHPRLTSTHSLSINP